MSRQGPALLLPHHSFTATRARSPTPSALLPHSKNLPTVNECVPFGGNLIYGI